MRNMLQRAKSFVDWLSPWPKTDHSPIALRRGPQTHVIILDGTMSSLREGRETNAGLTYRLLSEVPAGLSIYYEAGVQWQDWRAAPAVAFGRGINRQIRRAYGYLASRYRPGDKIFLMGYSRGAFAVRSLAGVIDSVGLLRADAAIERNITQAYRHYRHTPDSAVAKAFRARFCHAQTPIEMVGVWDTVMALGLRLPLIWRFSSANHAFHNHEIAASILHGYHALAMEETRLAYAPELWHSLPEYPGTLEQVWFRGTHGDIGGQLDRAGQPRGLANIPLVWMLSRAEDCGLSLPNGWAARFPCDVTARSCSTWHGWGKLFLLRGRRVIGADPSERIHESVQLPTDATMASPGSAGATAARVAALGKPTTST